MRQYYVGLFLVTLPSLFRLRLWLGWSLRRDRRFLALVVLHGFIVERIVNRLTHPRFGTLDGLDHRF